MADSAFLERLTKLLDKSNQLTQFTDDNYKLLRNADQLENDAQRLVQGKGKSGDSTKAFAFLDLALGRRPPRDAFFFAENILLESYSWLNMEPIPRRSRRASVTSSRRRRPLLRSTSSPRPMSTPSSRATKRRSLAAPFKMCSARYLSLLNFKENVRGRPLEGFLVEECLLNCFHGLLDDRSL